MNEALGALSVLADKPSAALEQDLTVLIDGTAVMVGDIRVNIPVSSISFQPSPNDRVFTGSNLSGPQSVVNYNQRFFNGSARHWEIQCR